MKQAFVLLISFFLVIKCESQILKKIGGRIKDETSGRLSNKIDNEIRKGVDSIFEMPNKNREKNNAKASTEEIDKNSTANNSTAKQAENVSPPNNSLKVPAKEETGVTQKDGFLTLNLSSDKIIKTTTLIISGESVLYQNFKEVEIKVTGPSPPDVRKILLSREGKYSMEWVAPEIIGDYIVTVTGSDKKTSQTATFSVEDFVDDLTNDWPEANIKETKEALENLEEAVDNVEADISTKDKATLEEKMDELREKTAEVLDFFKELNTAGKEISKLAKSGKRMSPTLAGNLSQLIKHLNEQASQMKKISEVTNHKPADNTVCEYLVMVNEACAAFSTFNTVWAKAGLTILKNVVADKGPPTTVEVINKSSIPTEATFMGKEAGKYFAKSLFKAESLSTKLVKADFAGDFIKYISEGLLKTYCGSYKGIFTHDYTIEFRNNKGENWWAYGAEMRATIFLRYPKKNEGDIIKMKGNLEGNATKFTFFQDVAKENDFHAVSKGKLEVVPIKTYTPLAVSVATSERDIMGFGAIARGLATPAYFNIAIDAEYDVNTKKIKIFVNKSIADFSDFVANQFVFLMVGQDLIPYPKTMSFPIHKAKTTINGIFISFKEFDVEKDSKGNESFHGKGTRHIGDKTSIRETNLNFTLSAKKDN